MSLPKTLEESDDDGLAALGIEIGDRIGRYVVLSQSKLAAEAQQWLATHPPP
jgi:hypothetical protein